MQALEAGAICSRQYSCLAFLYAKLCFGIPECKVKSRLDRFHQTKAQPRGAQAGDHVDGRDGQKDTRRTKYRPVGKGMQNARRKKASASVCVATTRKRNRADNRMRTEKARGAQKDGRWNSATGYTERAKEADRLEGRGWPEAGRNVDELMRSGGKPSTTSLRK